MRPLLYPLAAVVAWTACGLKLRLLSRNGRSAPLVAVAVACALLATAFSTATSVNLMPGVWGRVNGFFGADFSSLIEHICVMAFSTSILVLLVIWAYPPEAARVRTRRLLAVVAVTLGATVTLYLLAKPGYTSSLGTAWETVSPLYVAYLLLYLLVFTAMLVEIVRLCRRYARLLGPSWLRHSLRLTASGAAVGMGYTIGRSLQVAAGQLDVHVRGLAAVAHLSAAFGAILVMAGLSAPSWGPAVSSLMTWTRGLRSYRRLRPLWLALCQAEPQIALAVPSAGRWGWTTWPMRDLDLRLARRVVEIRDGRLAIHDWFDARVAEAAREHFLARGLTGDDLAAAVEAAVLRAALTAKAADAPACAPADRAVEDQARDEAMASLVDETAWLVRVALAFRKVPSPSVPMTTAPRHERETTR